MMRCSGTAGCGMPECVSRHPCALEDGHDGLCQPTAAVASLNEPQPAPMASEGLAIWDLVIEDMRDRDVAGFRKYRTRLQPFNGRDALVDAYQEALDLTVYLRQAIFERDGR